MDIELSDDAAEQWADLPASIHARVEQVFERLRGWPQVSGVKWLIGNWRGHARIRTGDYRVVFHLVDDSLILIDRIAHRSDVYAE